MTSNDINVYRGNDINLNITVTDSNGSPVDITGYTLWFTVKSDENDSDDEATIQKTVTSHTDPTNGLTTFELTNTDTDIPHGTYLYDMQMKDTSNKITTLTKGYFNVTQDITQKTA
jgi:hypothetical protein